MKVVAVLLVALAVAFAQDYTLVPLTGVPSYSNSFTTTDAPYKIHVYTLMINENVAYASINITQPTTTCTLYVSGSGNEVPCGTQWDIDSSAVMYPCRGNTYTTTSFDQGDYVIYPDDYSQYKFVNLGSMFFITVTRSYFYDTDACDYTIAPTVMECGTGNVSALVTGSTYECFALNRLDNGPTSTNTTYKLPNFNLTSTEYKLFRIWVPAGTGSVHIMGNVNTTYSAPSIYVSQNRVPNYYVRDFSFSYNTYNVDTYFYDEWIFNPVAGYMYVSFGLDTIDMGVDISIVLNVCGAGVGGWNCTYTVQSVDSPSTMVSATASVVRPDSTNLPFGTDGAEYFILKTTTSMPTAFANYTVTPANNDIYVYYRKNAFVDNLQYNYIESTYYELISTTPFTVALTPADLSFPGWFVLAVTNDAAVGSTVTATVTSSYAASTTGAATTEATTAATTGAASSVAYCFALIALCVAALF